MMELFPEDVPSMNNIYDSKYWEKVRNDEQNRSNKMYDQANSPFITGIVSTPTYASMFQTLDTQPNNERMSLTGKKIDAESFTHNNMEPFFKGNVTQNVDPDRTTSRLDINTGVDKFYKNKKEVECFFKPTSGIGNEVCGMKNYDDYYKEHIVPSKLRTSVFPIESVKVAPGLNKGYTSHGTGGFQQADSLDYARPKNMNELRSKINEKCNEFEGQIQGPVKGTDQRGIVTPFAKNKPEKSYDQTPDQWMKTTGANLKSTERPEQYIKATSRVDSHSEYVGVANAGIVKGSGESDDYGKSKITIYDNERQFTETKTVVSNVTSIVKAIVSPIVDVLKYSLKEYTIDAPRAGGNIKTQIPEKATLYDPVNHVMKTTIKETTLHDTEMINLTGPDESYSSLQDQAKTTVKETTIHDSELINLTGPDESYSALQDLAKTTIKETTIHDTEMNNIKGPNKNYVNSDDDAKKTIRETVPVQDTTRNIGACVYKVYVYDPDLALKTTVKETTIKGKSQFGFLGGILEGLMGAYATIPVELKNTQKQFTSDYNEYGIAGPGDDLRQTSREADYNAEIDDTREKLLIEAGYTPNAGNNMGIIGSGKNDINMTTKKQFENSLSERNIGNISKIYQSSPTPINKCSITRPQLLNNAYENRLDSSLLEPLKSNEFDIRINPIKNCKI